MVKPPYARWSRPVKERFKPVFAEFSSGFQAASAFRAMPAASCPRKRQSRASPGSFSSRVPPRQAGMPFVLSPTRKPRSSGDVRSAFAGPDPGFDHRTRGGAGAAAREGHVRDQLGGRGRARRLLPGAGRRHLPQSRPRRDHSAGRAERQSPPAAAGRQDPVLHERQHAAGVRRGRAEHADAGGRVDVPEGPAGAAGAPRPGRREVRRPEEADAVRVQGRAGLLLPVDEAGVRLQRAAGEALHLQSAALPRRQEERDAGLRHVGAVRGRDSRASSSRRSSCSRTRASAATRP